MNLPQNHPQRFDLNNEVHARPSEALEAPLRVSYIALFGPRRDDDLEPVRWLARQYGAPLPEPGTSHYSGHFGQFRLRWERHTEFARYMFIVPGVPKGNPFDEPAVEQIPRDLVMRLPGETIAAAHAVLVKGGETPTSHDEVAQRCFGSNIMIGSSIAGGAGLALTDFRIHADGFTRFWIEDRGMNPFQAGRLVQRLLEIETYRMMALLALPVARELAPFLRQSERELAEITSAIAADTADEPLLLNRLTRLEALIEGRNVENHYRFSAARAYYDLVHQRISELREERIRGLQTLQEFTERRLAPAMATCLSVSQRQDTLSERVSRATQLLSTRVDITRSRQNQDLLASMNRRAKMQLRLQETVEGFSVAAVSYYIVGLVGYLAKGFRAAGLGIDPDLAMGASLPFVVVLTALGIGRLRKVLTGGRSKSSARAASPAED